MTIRKKQRLFIDAYTDRTSPETYDNGTQSAKYAGYSDKHGPATACQLLKRDDIKEEIARLNQQWDMKFTDTLDNKIKIAWDNYLKFSLNNKHQTAHKWYEEHGKLSGHYTTKIDQVVHLTPQEESEIDAMMNKLGRIDDNVKDNRLMNALSTHKS